MNWRNYCKKGDKMALTKEEQQVLNEHGDLYRRFRSRDLFSSAGAAAAAVSDIVSGKASASSLLKKYGGDLSPSEIANQKAVLLEQLRQYQESRRLALSKSDTDRHETFRKSLEDQNATTKWAMEEEAKLLDRKMQGVTQLETSKLGILTAQMNQSDREAKDGHLAAHVGGVFEARQAMSPTSLAKVENAVLAAAGLAGDEIPVGDKAFLDSIRNNLEGIPAAERNFALTIMRAEIPAWNTAENTLADQGEDGKALRKSGGGRWAGQFNDDAGDAHNDQSTTYAKWKGDRKEKMDLWERRYGAGVDKGFIARLRGISEKTPDQMTEHLNAVMAAAPGENVATENELPEDEYTKRVNAELDKLDDPRYNFTGSRHERIRQQIMGSPEFKQYQAEMGDGGPVDPDVAFTQMLADTKGQLGQSQGSVETMRAADTATGAAAPSGEPRAVPEEKKASWQKPGGIEKIEPEAAAGAARSQIGSAGSDVGSNADSTLNASAEKPISQSQRRTGRLKGLLGEIGDKLEKKIKSTNDKLGKINMGDPGAF